MTKLKDENKSNKNENILLSKITTPINNVRKYIYIFF